MKRSYLLAALAAVLVLGMVIVAVLYRADLALLMPGGPVAFAERHVILVTFFLSSLVIVPVFFFLFVFAYLFREGGSRKIAEQLPDWDQHSTQAEIVWWTVPTVIIAILSVLALQSTYALDPYKEIASEKPPLTIEVVALPWKWLFLYPDQGIATVNQVTFPAGTPVRFVITADAPMNAFWIPKLAGMIMAMPGMTTEMNVLAEEQGSYEGRSGNLSGDGFAGMVFTASAVSDEGFRAWVEAQKGNPPLEYDALARPSSNEAPAAYSLTEPGLYTSIVRKYLPPSEAPHGLHP